jgi:protein TonB
MGAGKSVDNFDGTNADWSFAAPDTISADLLKLVCKTAFNEAVSNSAPTHVDIAKLKTTYQPNTNSYYPSYSKRSGEAGQIEVRIIVSESGVVESANVLRSSGYLRLDQAAIEVSSRYRFEPYLINFVPTRVSTSLLITFN